jgi:hypothetical protein
MQIAKDDSLHNSNPRAPLTRVLLPHRRARLRHEAPHHEFRDPFVEPRLDFAVDTVGGATLPLRRLLETEEQP